MSPKDIILKPKLNPLMASLPDYLKDPANYEKVQKTVIQALQGKHSHGEVVEWAGCAECQRRFRERRHVLKSLGFKNPAQYKAWTLIHKTIKERVPLPKYNS